MQELNKEDIEKKIEELYTMKFCDDLRVDIKLMNLLEETQSVYLDNIESEYQEMLLALYKQYIYKALVDHQDNCEISQELYNTSFNKLVDEVQAFAANIVEVDLKRDDARDVARKIEKKLISDSEFE